MECMDFHRRRLLQGFAASMVYPLAAQEQAAEDHPKISEDRIYRFEDQEITVLQFEAEGFILDIGGGGEGVIGQVKRQQVIAIDLSKRELAEAPPGPLKLVMDARDLKFLDESFPTVTSFFTLMYVPQADHEKVFREIFRVLLPGGRFLVWDVNIAERIDPARDIAVFPFRFQLPNGQVRTAYGMRWPAKPQGLPYYAALARQTGFQVATEQLNGRTFYMELRKP